MAKNRERYGQWVPLVRSNYSRARPDVKALLDAMDQKALAEEEARTTYWVNDIYQVARIEEGGNLIHLSIRRRDGRPIFRDWRHFQEIKNQLIGTECEALELYPAESRKVDATNKYHLYGIADPTVRIPVGWEARDVQDAVPGASPGIRQRKL